MASIFQENLSPEDIRDIKEILVTQGYLTEEEFEQAREESEEQGVPLFSYLSEQGLINRDIFGQAVGEFFKLPYINLNYNPPSSDYTAKIPQEVAQKYRVIFCREESDKVLVTTDVPVRKNRKKIKKALSKYFDQEITVCYSLPEEVTDALRSYRAPLPERLKEILNKEDPEASEILEEILEEAYEQKVSDVHFEPPEEGGAGVRVRFRKDGVMNEVAEIPDTLYPRVVNRIKVNAHIRIDTHQKMQDGAFRYSCGSEEIDVRLSIAPTLGGEKVCMRLLAQYIEELTFAGLGLTENQEKILNQAARKPFGMILVAGPTGSGKTTTLYAVMKLLNTSLVNITTIEDPVEYHIKGINQIQVNESKDITFAKGLRSIVRQDPDIILVGEIRDQETNQIAVNAALTGHLLLSTFHANDAATGVPRLIDMGAEPFLLASTLEVIIAQRLVRTLCSNCRHSIDVSLDEIRRSYPEAVNYFNQDPVRLYQGKGCESCGFTGYRGRSALFEMIQITPEMRRLIIKSPSKEEILELARAENTEFMYDNGIGKAQRGETTLEEVHRVVLVS